MDGQAELIDRIRELNDYDTFLGSGEHVLTTGEKKFYQHTVTLRALAHINSTEKMHRLK